MNDKVNILIVDDLPDKLLAFQSILEELHENLVFARSGREALQKLLEHDFAVILLDVNMPDIDGLETAKLIRQYRRTRQTPIVFITSYMDDFQTIRGYALGAVDYISMPVVPVILRSKVKVFVDLYRMHIQLQKQVEEREALARAEAARDASEIARRRADLLADASHILTHSLDIDAIINGLLTFALSNFASVAIVTLFQDDRPQDRRKLTRASLAFGEHEEFRVTPEDFRVELEELPSQLMQAIAKISIKNELINLAHAGALKLPANDFQDRTLPLGAVKLLPMFGRGKLIGAIVLGIQNSPTQESDDSVLKEIASRSAIVIENALLYGAIRDANRHKNEFLAMLSHELRNPLAPIRNAAHILQAQPGKAEQVRWAGEIISRQVEHMAHIMNDLLDVSRIARGVVVLEKQKILLADVIERSLETCRPLLEASQHQLEISLPEEEIELQGDPVRLSQIFSNLIHNSTKYSPNGSQIWLSASYEEKEVVISVRDNGHGIEAGLLPHIFDLFVQGDTSIERQQSGLGVGLTLVKHLVDLHFGSIEAKSLGIGKGAEFIVRFPARCTQSVAVGAASNTQASISHRGRVLVVDDLEVSANSMKLLLEMKGYESAVAHDGPSALIAVDNFRPDVILLDIGLPGMDGYEVSRQLHKDSGDDAPFIIALTGYGQEADRQKAADSGIDLHVVKPADVDELLTQIAAFCAARIRPYDKTEVA